MSTGNRQSLYLGSDERYSGGALLRNLLAFGRVCRGVGMEVSPHRMTQVARGLQSIDLGRKDDFFFAVRALIVTRAADLPRFEEAFRLFWRRHSDAWTRLDLRSLGEDRPKRKTRFLPSEGHGGDRDDPGQRRDPVLLPTYSPCEALGNKDFADMTGEELATARALVRWLARSLDRQKTRRLQAGPGSTFDLRLAMRSNLRHGGELLELPRRTRKVRPRPIVLLCDISGSMERYTRILLHFAHALSTNLHRVETFLFGTRLTRVTGPFRIKSVDQAVRSVTSKVRDWSGGTLTGQALRRFNFEWGRRTLGGGSVVLLITDGWDRGDPELLARETARLKRSCKRLIWLNPLLGGPQYEPLTRGARAIAAHVDDLLSVRDLAGVGKLAAELGRVDWRRTRRLRDLPG